MAASPSLFSTLYCQEHDLEEHQQPQNEINYTGFSLLPLLLLDQNLFQDEDLHTLFSKEKQILTPTSKFPPPDSSRTAAVNWMLTAVAFYGFSPLTATLSVNYLDRFISLNALLQPWSVQLAAVASLSLAAKIEETHVPLLLDLQVAGVEYMFEPRSIQKMELLILTALDWKMHPVTPIDFLHHIIRRLGLKIHLQLELLRRSEKVLLSIIADSSVGVWHLPSVLAVAIMLHVIDRIEPSMALDYRSHLLSVLDISPEKVMNCYEMIVEKASESLCNKRTRRTSEEMAPGSPTGVIDSCYMSSDGSSSDSWGNVPSTSSSVSSSPDGRAMKRSKRVSEQFMPLRVFVNNDVGSP